MSRFQCPHCGEIGNLAGRCFRCDVTLVDHDRLPPWKTAGLSRDVSTPSPRTHVTIAGGAVGVAAGAMAGSLIPFTIVTALSMYGIGLVAICVLWLLLAREIEPSDYKLVGSRVMNPRIALPLYALAGAILLPFLVNTVARWSGTIGVAIVAGTLGAAFARMARRRPRDPDVRRFEDVALTSIRDASPGMVRIAGRVHVTHGAVGLDGEPTAAYEQRTSAADAFSVRSFGGVFEIDDGTGQPARVSAEWVRVLDGNARGDALTVPDGAEIEIIGTAVCETDASGASSYRVANRRVTLHGTQEQPLLIRVRARSSPPVRVAANAVTSPVRVDPERSGSVAEGAGVAHDARRESRRHEADDRE